MRRFSIVCLGIWTVSYAIVVAVVMQMNAAAFGQLTFVHASPSAPLSLTCAKSQKNIKKGTETDTTLQHVARTLVATCVGFRARLVLLLSLPLLLLLLSCCCCCCHHVTLWYAAAWITLAVSNKCSVQRERFSKYSKCARSRVRCLSLSFAYALLRWCRCRRRRRGVAHNLSTALWL